MFIPLPVFNLSDTASAGVEDGGRDAPSRLDENGA
jgi:hypothetical protein